VSNKKNKKKHPYNNPKNTKKISNKKGKNFYSSSFVKKKKYNEDVRVVSTNVKSDDTKSKSDSSKVSLFNKKSEFNKKSDKNINGITNNKERLNRNNYKKNNNEEKKVINNKNKVIREIIPYTLNKAKKEVCFVCNRIIADMHNVINDPDNNRFFHFDCILQELKKNNNLDSTQRIVYTGSGNFAIIEDIIEDGRKKFVIKKNIQYIDNKDTK